MRTAVISALAWRSFILPFSRSTVNESTSEIKIPSLRFNRMGMRKGEKHFTEQFNWISTILYFFFFPISPIAYWSRTVNFFLLRSPPFDIVLTKSLSIHLTLNDSLAGFTDEASRMIAKFPPFAAAESATSDNLHIYLLLLINKFCAKYNFISTRQRSWIRQTEMFWWNDISDAGRRKKMIAR